MLSARAVVFAAALPRFPGGFPTKVRPTPVIVNNLTVAITDLPVELTGLRIAHVSDFHFHRWNRVTQAAQDILLSLEYDLLVATGDFADSRKRWVRAARMTGKFFGPLAGRAPIYAVLGNHDDPRIATAPGMPLIFLRNEARPVDFAGTALELAGVEQNLYGGEDLDAALGSSQRSEIAILLAHYPSTVFRLPPGRVDLVLSGHTHGGQIRFPVLGCLWAHDRIPVRMARGLHRVGATWLHTSPGIGVCAPLKVRINCPPEVSVLTLEPVDGRSEPSSDEAPRPSQRPSFT